MKIRITLKDPDTMPDAVDDAFAKLQIDGLTPHELAVVRQQRAIEARTAICAQWMPYGEYLIVEFDTEAGTATVLPGSEMR